MAASLQTAADRPVCSAVRRDAVSCECGVVPPACSGRAWHSIATCGAVQYSAVHCRAVRCSALTVTTLHYPTHHSRPSPTITAEDCPAERLSTRGVTLAPMPARSRRFSQRVLPATIRRAWPGRDQAPPWSLWRSLAEGGAPCFRNNATQHKICSTTCQLTHSPTDSPLTLPQLPTRFAAQLR